MITAGVGKPPAVPLQKVHISSSAHSVWELEALGFLKLQKAVIAPHWASSVQPAVLRSPKRLTLQQRDSKGYAGIAYRVQCILKVRAPPEVH